MPQHAFDIAMRVNRGDQKNERGNQHFEHAQMIDKHILLFEIEDRQFSQEQQRQNQGKGGVKNRPEVHHVMRF